MGARAAGARRALAVHARLHMRSCCNSFSLALGCRDSLELWSLATSWLRPAMARLLGPPPRLSWLVLAHGNAAIVSGDICNPALPAGQSDGSAKAGMCCVPNAPDRGCRAPGSDEPPAYRPGPRLASIAPRGTRHWHCSIRAFDPHRAYGGAPGRNSNSDTARERCSTTSTDRAKGVDAIEKAMRPRLGGSL